jgi:hypothetical protein
MTDEMSNLVLEHLRAIRCDMAHVSDDIKGLKTEMMAVRLHGLGVETVQERDHSDIAQLKDRIDRIEARLGLVD